MHYDLTGIRTHQNTIHCVSIPCRCFDTRVEAAMPAALGVRLVNLYSNASHLAPAIHKRTHVHKVSHAHSLVLARSALPMAMPCRLIR